MCKCVIQYELLVNEMYDIVRKIMGKTINAEYADTSHYWVKYPQLYSGAYPIRDEILNHEVNKYSLCDNSLAKEKYGWTPRIGIEEGLKNVINYEVQLLAGKHSLYGS